MNSGRAHCSKTPGDAGRHGESKQACAHNAKSSPETRLQKITSIRAHTCGDADLTTLVKPCSISCSLCAKWPRMAPGDKIAAYCPTSTQVWSTWPKIWSHADLLRPLGRVRPEIKRSCSEDCPNWVKQRPTSTGYPSQARPMFAQVRRNQCKFALSWARFCTNTISIPRIASVLDQRSIGEKYGQEQNLAHYADLRTSWPRLYPEQVPSLFRVRSRCL